MTDAEKRLATKAATRLAARSGAKLIPVAGEALMLLDAAPEAWAVTREGAASGTQAVRDVISAKGASGKAKAYGKGVLRTGTIFLRGQARIGTAALVGSLSKQNPSKGVLPPMFDGDVYDPREESIRAVARGTGGMWGVAVGKYAQGRSPQEIIQRSWERYQDPDHLVRSRNSYENMLGKNRQSGPYRVTLEPTRMGPAVLNLSYFVWPLPSRPTGARSNEHRIPVAYGSPRDAEREIGNRYAQGIEPAQALPPKLYTKQELAGWLPPDSVFDGRSARPTAAALRAPSREAPIAPRQLPASSGASLLDQYRAVSATWYTDVRMLDAYKRGEPPPRR